MTVCLRISERLLYVIFSSDIVVDRYDVLAREFIGSNYQDLTVQEQLSRVLANVPLDKVQRDAALLGIQNLDPILARDITLNLMESLARLPDALDNLETELKKLEEI